MSETIGKVKMQKVEMIMEGFKEYKNKKGCTS